MAVGIVCLMCNGLEASEDLAQKKEVGKFFHFMDLLDRRDIFFNYLLKNDNLTFRKDTNDVLELSHRFYSTYEIARKLNTLHSITERYKIVKVPSQIALENMGYPVNMGNINEMAKAFVMLGKKLAEKEEK